MNPADINMALSQVKGFNMPSGMKPMVGAVDKPQPIQGGTLQVEDTNSLIESIMGRRMDDARSLAGEVVQPVRQPEARKKPLVEAAKPLVESKYKRRLDKLTEAADWRSDVKFAQGRIEKALKYGDDMKSSSVVGLEDAVSLLTKAIAKLK